MLKLRLLQPDRPESVLRLDRDEVVIGRSADCDVVVAQPYVSKRHAKLVVGVAIVDLDSSNGTFVRGSRIEGAALVRDDPVAIGSEHGDVQIFVELETAGEISGAAAESVGPAGVEEGDLPQEAADRAGRTARLEERVAALEATLERLREELELSRRSEEREGRG